MYRICQSFLKHQFSSLSCGTTISEISTSTLDYDTTVSKITSGKTDYRVPTAITAGFW